METKDDEYWATDTRKLINWPIESSVFFNNYYLFLCVLFAPFVAR